MSHAVSMRPLGKAPGAGAAAAGPDVLCIFGTGDLGRSLGLRLLQSGYRVVYGSRRADSCGPVPPGAEVSRSFSKLHHHHHHQDLSVILTPFFFWFVSCLLSPGARVFACVQVMGHAEAAEIASLIFLCVHREHYGFLSGLAPILQGKVNA